MTIRELLKKCNVGDDNKDFVNAARWLDYFGKVAKVCNDAFLLFIFSF
jgi:hypothetical protein